MLIRQRKSNAILPSEITPKEVYLNRRHFMQGSLAAAVGLSSMTANALVLPDADAELPSGPDWLEKKVISASESSYGANDKPAPYSAATKYNNFYEFGTNKTDPARNASTLTTDPWNVRVEGLCEVKGNFALEDLMKDMDLEERIYRLRCV
ncbi:MAG: mononuclear molybdenum enzyme YedY, partial [Oleibacter sp.]|nr:mononuclear molybdenum enzyme YedY [Thalassolituus sp.]